MSLGYLRETTEDALKAGVDIDTNIVRTGLEEYLKIIFPDIDDWVHNKVIPNPNKIKELKYKRPDYRSESLKLIIEFDGLPHYTNPIRIIKDIENTKIYEKHGYKVVRIPYFIQLTHDNVLKLFNKDISDKLFPDNIPSLTIHSQCTPAFLCVAGIKRMADEFKNFPDDYNININYLKNISDDLSYMNGVELLEYYYNN